MKKIILVQPENGLNSTTYAPLGLMSLASYIRADFEVEIIDLRLSSEDKLFDLIKKEKPLAVGFSMLTGSCILQVIAVSQKIKNIDPSINIITGGIHPTFFPEQTLANPLIDFVIVSEGEKPLKSLLIALENNAPLAEIDNLGWKENGQLRINKIADDFLDMNELPMPAWDLIEIERYVKFLSPNPDERVINFYTSKGCPFPCSFCYNLNFNKKKWRAKTAEKAFAELEFLHKNYNINYFIIHDDNFVVDRARALEFARLIKNKNLKIKYSVDARVDYFDFKFLQEMKESGLCELRVGCESGSNRVLKEVIQKGITIEQTVKAVEVAKSLDLKLMLSFVVGWPTETIIERQETIDLILRIQKIYTQASVYPLWIYIPYPGTALFIKALTLGFNPPQSLEEWGSYFWGKAYLPWLKNQGEYEIIHELSPFAWYSKKLKDLNHKSFKGVIRHLAIKFFRFFIILRFKNNFWRWPIEIYTIVWLKNKLKSIHA